MSQKGMAASTAPIKTNKPTSFRLVSVQCLHCADLVSLTIIRLSVTKPINIRQAVKPKAEKSSSAIALKTYCEPQIRPMSKSKRYFIEIL